MCQLLKSEFLYVVSQHSKSQIIPSIYTTASLPPFGIKRDIDKLLNSSAVFHYVYMLVAIISVLL
jgi:hypothetical protein